MDEEIVVVETTSGMMEAEILRGLLEAQDITVWLLQESAGRAIGLGVGPLGQVDLMVPADQAAEATRILDDYYAGRLMEQDDQSPEES
ncbi:MAG TPA: DUF2007 domain-containing protein [Anaerolineae bacterium]|nr:MAG: hypothetical protein AMJ88_16085 [Anaerolineae bacterium SM23_ 63]HEY42845.1 DUF2007 domain-containing protein [Anaerolineae bacterium]